jgi:NitT/TauT family transport system ATP-binding protein
LAALIEEGGAVRPPRDPARMGDAVVRLSAIDKAYTNGVLALRELTFEVRDGEFLSLLGPSGCGKSTALRILAGLAEASTGTVHWPGGGAPAPGELGFVFQEPTLMPWATVAANVRLPLRFQVIDRREADKRVAEAIERVGLGGFERAYPRELSGGMKMRASIARALVTRPRLLLMDEPFAALDEITRFKLNHDLLDLWSRERLTIVFVTHSVFESVYLSNRILVMAARPGRVVDELSIDASYPRDEAFRTSAEYASLCRQVSQALQRAMAGAG